MIFLNVDSIIVRYLQTKRSVSGACLITVAPHNYINTERLDTTYEISEIQDTMN